MAKSVGTFPSGTEGRVQTLRSKLTIHASQTLKTAKRTKVRSDRARIRVGRWRLLSEHYSDYKREALQRQKRKVPFNIRSEQQLNQNKLKLQDGIYSRYLEDMSKVDTAPICLLKYTCSFRESESLYRPLEEEEENIFFAFPEFCLFKPKTSTTF